jgi:hypothetical protein
MSYGRVDSPVSNWCGTEDPAQSLKVLCLEEDIFSIQRAAACVGDLTASAVFPSVIIAGNVRNYFGKTCNCKLSRKPDWEQEIIAVIIIIPLSAE